MFASAARSVQLSPLALPWPHLEEFSSAAHRNSADNRKVTLVQCSRQALQTTTGIGEIARCL
jgi:hypothetical protein